MSELLKNDVDPIETNDWLAAIDSLIREEGIERAQFIIDQVMQQARAGGVSLPSGITTDYVNTIPVSEQPAYPGNLEIERRIRSYVRWNAVMMVLRGQKKDLDLGGHLSTFQSAATMYEVGFNHFFKAATEKNGGDLVFFQGHAAPGMYARAFLEGRLTEEQLNNELITKNGVICQIPYVSCTKNIHYKFLTNNVNLIRFFERMIVIFISAAENILSPNSFK